MDYDSSVFAILGGFIFVLAIVGIILYVFMALGMQSMATKLRIENPWLAWIPVGNLYLMGRIAGDRVTIFNKDIEKLGFVLLIGGICMGVISSIPVIGFLACIAYAVIYCVALYKVYRIFAEDSAMMYCILSIVINVTAPFFIFFASKNEPNLAIFNEGPSGGVKEAPVASTPIITEPIYTPEPEREAAPEMVSEVVSETEEAPAETQSEDNAEA